MKSGVKRHGVLRYPLRSSHSPYASVISVFDQCCSPSASGRPAVRRMHSQLLFASARKQQHQPVIITKRSTVPNPRLGKQGQTRPEISVLPLHHGSSLVNRSADARLSRCKWTESDIRLRGRSKGGGRKPRCCECSDSYRSVSID